MPTPLVVATSPHDVASTVDRIRTALRSRGVTLFATVDHAAGAREAGLALADEILLVFGNPAVGTGLMQADPRVGLDLPLRLLVWDERGTTRIAFSDPVELARHYGLDDHLPVLSQMRALLDQVVAEATWCPEPEVRHLSRRLSRTLAALPARSSTPGTSLGPAPGQRTTESADIGAELPVRDTSVPNRKFVH